MTAATIKLIHVGCRSLGIDEDTRRDLSLVVTGKDSLRAMSEAELEQVLGALKERGFLPERPSIDLIQSWLRHPAFVTWFDRPEGSWPLARLPAEQAAQIGANDPVAFLSAETVAKQKEHHPELIPIEYSLAQEVIEQATHVVQDTASTLVFIRANSEGYVLVVKATKSGERLFIQSFRRLSANEAARDTELRRLLAKGS